MTPEERNLVSELFDRLATLEDAPRDREAERMVQDGLRQAPNAPYALVQTVLVQDEALKRADARIRELESQLSIGAEPPQQGGFLDSMRNSLWGRRDAPRAGSVPSVQPSGAPMGVPPGYSAEAQPPGAGPMAQPSSSPGGSFLGTAAATAAGVIGASLLLNSIRGMTGQPSGGAAHAAGDPTSGGSPWGGSGGSGDLARQAGLDDIGRSSSSRDDAGRSHGVADSEAARAVEETTDANHASTDYASTDDDDFVELDDGDFGGGFDGGGD